MTTLLHDMPRRGKAFADASAHRVAAANANALLLLEQFDAVVSTPEAVDELDRAILQLAVQGKLVAQDPNDEPASELLKRIRDEQDPKGFQKPFGSIRDDEKPFELPVGWEWASIPDVSFNWGQKKPDKTFTYIDVSSIDNQVGEIGDGLQIVEPEDASSRARKIVQQGSVIYATVRPYLLNIAIVDQEFNPPPIVSTAFYVMHPRKGVDGRFLLLYLRSRFFIDFVSLHSTGIAYPAISDSKFSLGVVPLPPTNEQRRIVARVEQLFAQTRALREKLARSQAELARVNESALAHLLKAETPKEFHAHWSFIAQHFDTLYTEPEHIAPLRQTILELAVRGKLTRREPDDEPASELLKRIREHQDPKGFQKPFGSIRDDEKPFELPEGWEWVQFGELGDQRLGQMLDKQKNRGEYYPYLRNVNVQWLRIDFTDIAQMRFEQDRLGEFKLCKGDLLICEGGEPGRCAIWERDDLEMMFQKAIHRVRPYGGIVPKYLLYHLWADARNGVLEKYFTGATIKHLTGKSLAIYLCALPPIAEQRRIVARVEQLMKLCDDLEAKLTAARDERERLTAALLAEIA